MKNCLSRMVRTVQEKISTFTATLSGSRQGRYYDRSAQARERRRHAAGDATPVQAKRAPVSERKEKAVPREPFRPFAFVADKKRFSIVTGAIAALVLVPVIAVSANGEANNMKRPENKPVAGVEESAEPAAQPAVQLAPTPVPVPSPGAAPTETGALLEQTDTPAGVDGAVVSGDLTALPDPTSAPAPTQTPETQYMDLTPETRHANVITLQQRLMELRYMENDEPTDYYGPITQQAVGYFQRKVGLAVDGIAGVETQTLLFAADAKEYSVTVGAEGADVGNIQQRLADLGYPTTATNYFGTETEAAVKYFQRMNSLTDDGSVGHYTKEMLFSEEAEPAEEYKQPQPSASSGSSGENSASQGGESASGEAPPAPTAAPAPAANPGNVEAFVNAALAQEGKKYVLGGKGPDTFDCSGLVYYALNASGNSVGYMTSGGWKNSDYASIGFGDLQRGDVICITGHVGVYLGDGTMVDASSSNGKVVVRAVGSWAQNNFICGKRPLA